MKLVKVSQSEQSVDFYHNSIIEELNMFRSLQEKLLGKNYSPTPKLLLKQNDIFSIPEKYKNSANNCKYKELFTSIIEKTRI